MKSFILKTTAISLAFAAGLLVALPAANASSCSGGKCSTSNHPKSNWIRNCSQAPVTYNSLASDSAQGTLHGSIYSSNHIPSYYPGCAQIVTIANVKQNKCYRITFSGTMDINCDGKKKDRMPWDAFFSLSPYNYNQAKYKASLIQFNGQPISQTSSEINQLTFQSNHVYTYDWYSGNSSTITMKINDSNYIDNTGWYNYTIQKVSNDQCDDAPKPTPTPTVTPSCTPTPQYHSYRSYYRPSVFFLTKGRSR